MSKDFFKLFSPVVDEKLTNAGTSDGVKKSWETRKLGSSGEIYSKASPFAKAYVTSALWSSTDSKDEPLDSKYSHHDIHPASLQHMVDDARKFEKDNAEHIGPHSEQAGHDYWLTRNGHGAGFWDRPEVYGEDHAKALTDASRAAGSKDLYDAKGKIYQAGLENYKPEPKFDPLDPLAETTPPHNIPHIRGPGWGFGQPGVANSEILSASDRLLNSGLTGGVQMTVGQLATGLTTALGDKLTNSKYGITDILCPDETGHWAVVLNDRKCFFTLKDGQPLLNWEHKEKKERDYQPWDEEPKVDGAWDEDLIGGGDEIMNSGKPEDLKNSSEKE
jgi:hypothetical protein